MEVIERLMRDRLHALFIRNSFILEEQDGFTTGPSTVGKLSNCVFDCNLCTRKANEVTMETLKVKHIGLWGAA